MEIHQLRGWAELMDKAMIVSLVVAAIAVAALGATTWLSIRYNGAVRAHDNAALGRYKVEAADHAAKLEDHAAKLEKEVASATERNAALERTVAEAEERANQARKQAAGLEKAAADAKIETDEARLALERAKPPSGEPNRETSRETSREAPTSPIVASLARYAGTKAAIFALEEAPDAAEVGSSINALLGEAGWTSSTWKWTGVSGIVGVVVLTKEGRDPATDEAAAAIVGAFRSAGFNTAKADWPADWRRFRGSLVGPQTPNPTDAPIRVVIGARSR